MLIHISYLLIIPCFISYHFTLCFMFLSQYTCHRITSLIISDHFICHIQVIYFMFHACINLRSGKGNYKGPKVLYSLYETVVYKGSKALLSLYETMTIYKGPTALLSLYETMTIYKGPKALLSLYETITIYKGPKAL